MGISATLSHPFYGGAIAVAGSAVATRYPVALGGRGYLIDTESNDWMWRTIPKLRPQQDTADQPSERSFNPEGLWRRSHESWHKGAGQTWLDRPESDPYRFSSSKGIDPWTKWQFSLLPDTDKKRTSANTNVRVVPVGEYLYLSDGQSLLRTADITVDSPTWTTISGTPASNLVWVASDGYTVYLAYGTNGIYTTTRGAAAAASWVTGTVNRVAYVRGRVMASQGQMIYNITAAGALPAPLFTHPNTDWTWVGFAESLSQIYAAGFSGDKSIVYRTAVKADGTALDTPVTAAQLPDGEIVRSIQGYLGFILLGTDKGLRFASPDANGNLTLGALIDTNAAVNAFEGQSQYIWFGWTNYDATSTGLGRMDLTVFPSPGAPAYASDLMATTQGTVLSVATFQDRRVFTVSGQGVYAEDTTKVASGTIDSGYINFGVGEPKAPHYIDVRLQALNGGSYRAYIAEADDEFESVGLHTSSSTHDPFPVPNMTGDYFGVRLQLNRNSTTTTTGPVVARYTLQAEVAADVGTHIFLPVLLADRVDVDGYPDPRNPRTDLEYFRSIWQTKQRVLYQEGALNHEVILDDYEWRPYNRSKRENSAYAGVCVLKLKIIGGNN
jgi:hypothetical protein